MIQKRVILSAGHGAGDPGAVARGTTEREEVIQITDRVAEILRKNGGIEVVVMPHSIGNLVEEINWVNARYKGLYDALAVQIHKNAGGGTGNEVWTPSGGDDTIRAISAVICEEMTKSTGLRNRGVKDARNNRWGRLGWCDDTNTYACLIEAGFIDVDDNSDSMDAKMAEGIANGILRGLGVAKKVEAPVPQKQPVPEAVKLGGHKTIVMNLDEVNLWNLETNPNFQSVKKYKRGEKIRVYAKIDFNGSTYFITEWSFKKGIKNGFNSRDVIVLEETANSAENIEKTPEIPRTETQKKSKKDMSQNVENAESSKVAENLAVSKENNAILKKILALVEFLAKKIKGIFK